MVEVEVAQHPRGYVLVRFVGEIDMSHGDAVRRAFDAVLSAGAGAVLVDLCHLRFLSVTGADWIDAAVTELRDRGRPVRVACADRGPVWRVVRLLELDRHWPLHHDLGRAAADLADDPGDDEGPAD